MLEDLKAVQVAHTEPSVASVHEIPGKMCRILVLGLICRQVAHPVYLVGEVIGYPGCLSATVPILVKNWSHEYF